MTPVAARYPASAALIAAACGSDSCHIDQYVNVFASEAAAFGAGLLEQAPREPAATTAATVTAMFRL
ncbi:MAG: hypothetical protein ACJ786_04590 [Catenulispora sp.]